MKLSTYLKAPISGCFHVCRYNNVSQHIDMLLIWIYMWFIALNTMFWVLYGHLRVIGDCAFTYVWIGSFCHSTQDNFHDIIRDKCKTLGSMSIYFVIPLVLSVLDFRWPCPWVQVIHRHLHATIPRAVSGCRDWASWRARYRDATQAPPQGRLKLRHSDNVINLCNVYCCYRTVICNASRNPFNCKFVPNLPFGWLFWKHAHIL